MNFQGRLTDVSGNPLNGSYDMQLKLWDSLTVGTARWSETRLAANGQAVAVTNGLFSLKLGVGSTQTGSLATAFATYPNLYFEITVGAETLGARSQVATSAYAFNSNTLGGIDSSGFIQNQTGTTQTADFKINGSGTLSTLNATTSITLGTASSITGTLALKNGTSAYTLTLQSDSQTDNYSLTIPVLGANDTLCLVTLANCGGGSGVTTVGTIDTQTKSANGAVISGTSIYLQTADGTSPGLMSATTQTIGGAKTFNDNMTLATGKTITITGDTFANRPASATEGTIYYDSTNKQLQVYANGKWQADGKEAIIVAASNSSDADKASADYVADGNTAAGADGDQVQINQALAAANPAGAGRKTGKVVLLAGTYTLDVSISIPDNTILAGVGDATIITIPNTLNTNFSAIVNTNQTTGTGVTIQDLRLEGNKANQGGILGMAGIELYNMGGGTGVSARQGAKIFQVRSNNWYASNGATCQRGTGICLRSSSYNTIVGSSAQGNGRSGIEIISSSYNTLTNNSARSNEYGFRLDTSASSTLTGNTALWNSSVGFHLWTTTDSTLTNNTAQDNTTIGVEVTLSTNNNLSANTLYANGIGLYIETNSNNNTASANKIHDNGTSTNNNGIYVYNSDANTITSNDITDTAASSTNFAINIFNATSDSNYLADNRFSSTPGTSTINDAGTGTVYANQPVAENGMNLLNRSLNSTSAFSIQGTNKVNVFNVDTTNGEIELGSPTLAGKLVLSDGSSNTVSLSVGALAGDYTLAIPTITGNDTLCLVTLANCGGAGANTSLSNLTATNINQPLNTTAGDLTLQTTTSGNINISPVGSINLNSNVTVAAGKSLTLTGSGTRPSSGLTEGMLYYDTSTKQLLTYANSKWQADGKEAIIVAASNSSDADKAAAEYVAAGINSDEDAINLALTAADPAGSGRKTGKVVLLAGTYTINASVSIPNNTTLAGIGNATVITIPNALNANFSAIVNTNQTTGTGVTIQDLRLEGNRANQSGTFGMAGIDLYNMGGGTGTSARQGAKILQVRANGWYWTSGGGGNCQGGNGICLRSSSNNTLNGNTAQGNDTKGFYLYNSSNNTLTGNTAQGNTSNGFYLYNSSNITLTGNTAQENALNGFYLISSSNNNTLTGNTAQGNYSAGFNLSSSSNNTLTGNTAQGNGDDGFYLSTSANSNTITGNNLYNNGGTTDNNAIYVSGSSSNTITSNTIADTSFTSTNYAINIYNNTSSTNYLADNTLGGGSINDAGTGTIYSNQMDDKGNLINKGIGAVTIGTSTVNGTLSLQGGMTSVALGTPAAPVITTGGTAGTTSYSYTITALDGTGETLASTAGSTATGNATLTSGNYTIITWNKISGATSYNIYRTAGGATQGLISTVTAVAGSTQALNDTGLAASGSSPASNTTGGGNFAGALQSATGMSVGTASSVTGTLALKNSTSTYTLTLQSGAQTGNFTLSIPVLTANDTVCTVGLANCGGGGGGGLTRTVTLVPEFPGGILHADGSNNSGVMTSDSVNGLTSGQGYKHNYYQWTTTNAAAQDYDIVVNTALPSEYASTLANLKVWTYSSNLTNATATVQFQDNAGTNCYASPVAITPSSINTWQQITVGSMSGCTFAANDVVTITIHMVAVSSANFMVGEVSYTYSN